MSQEVTRRKFVTGAAALGTAAVVGGLAGCVAQDSGDGSSSAPSTESSASSSAESSSESSAAASVSVSPDPAKEILVASFGTSYGNSRHVTIGAIEDTIREYFPDWTQARAFTSQTVIDHIEKDTGHHINNIEEAVEQAIVNGVTTLVVQPTHLMSGNEYDDIAASIAEYEYQFEACVMGAPLCDSTQDQEAVAQACMDDTKQYDDGQTAIIYMGHGTDNESNLLYATMQTTFNSLGAENYYVGTVEAEPTLEDIMASIEGKGYTKAVLQPMMVVAGDHANNDMADPDDPASWYSKLTAAGLVVTVRLVGLGSLEAIDKLYAEHAQAAIDTLTA